MVLRLPEADKGRFFLSLFPRAAFALFFLPPVPFRETAPALLLFTAPDPDAFFSLAFRFTDGSDEAAAAVPAVRLFFTDADLAPVFLFMVVLVPSP
ncbi:hypothetical protein HMPREF9413_3819 [Paenibacillus sp. HGF7]|nr:hypothetical protein HMPREF9413_3819 [Paenibacillus sp. HGF7]EPD90156.1 hypothetical protein HMPREF1207_01425 [Paenibacillus sp. HGH0039]